MPQNTNTIIAKILPYIGMGIFLVIMVIAFILLSYILLIGGIIGLILFGVAYIKTKFFSSNKKNVTVYRQHRPKGKIYDHNDLR